IKDGTWQVSQKSFNEKLSNGEIRIIPNKSGEWTVQHKVYQPEGRVFRSIYSQVSNTDSANELKALFSVDKFFENPKPSELIKQLVNLCVGENDIILDFFAGSSTSAHAVMQLNSEDGGNRKFIMVQLPEECNEKSEACKAGCKNIAEISKERIRRAGKKILEGECHEGWNKDIGFRVLKVDSSNMEEVYYSPDKVEQTTLSLMQENIKSDRSPEDLLFQIMLDWGVELSLPIEKQEVCSTEVFYVDGNALAACFDDEGRVTNELVEEIAKRQPLRVVFRDAGFKDDSIKNNVENMFKLLSPNTKVKTI
ncbi:MAG: DNA methyltransferase, partial [Syntrophaceae bacterium]|nr:DNA methyltransferase [Syntrophaceae bacterium]